jgi:hypothetical protein
MAQSTEMRVSVFCQNFFSTVKIGRWGCGDGKVQELFGPALWALSCRLVCGKKVRKPELENSQDPKDRSGFFAAQIYH